MPALNLPPEEIMREMSKLALEKAMLTLAQKAREMACVTSPHISGPDALEAFARAIENTNAKVWPTNPEAA